jgi:hypothetical protein
VRELGREAPDIFDHWVEALKRKAPDSGGVQAPLRRLDEARELLGRLTDQGKRQIVRQRLAGLLNIEEEALAAGGRLPAPAAPRPPAKPEAGPPTADQTALALLLLVMVHPETAGLVLENMADYWPPDPSRLLFDRLQAIFRARGEAGLAEVEGDDLPGPLANLVGQAAFEPRSFPSGQAEGAAGQHMGKLEKKWGRKRQAELSAGITRAQAAGDLGEVRRLVEEKEGVEARVRALVKK